MTSVSNARRCGNCHFAKANPQIVAQDISKRVCYGAPPTPHHVVAPMVNGGPPVSRLQMIRPIVGVSEEPCALHHFKNEVDMRLDSEAFRAAEEMLASEQAAIETKQ